METPRAVFAGFGYYLAFIGLMIACSVGLPLPEEAVLLWAGYLAADEATTNVNVVVAMSVCAFGVLLGDSLIYSLGRYVGPPVLQRWPFRKHFTPRRVRIAKLQFMKHGGKILFPVRVVPVVRAVAHFTAGMLQYSYPRFLLWDALGVALIVPASVWLAWRYGPAIETALAEGNFWMGVIIGGGFAAWAVWFAFFRKRAKQEPTVHELPTQVLELPPPAPAPHAPGPALHRPDAPVAKSDGPPEPI